MHVPMPVRRCSHGRQGNLVRHSGNRAPNLRRGVDPCWLVYAVPDERRLSSSISLSASARIASIPAPLSGLQSTVPTAKVTGKSSTRGSDLAITYHGATQRRQLTAGAPLLLQSHWMIEGAPFRVNRHSRTQEAPGRGRRSRHDTRSSPSRNGHTRSQIGPSDFTAA
jgi:hypothetical protein